MTKVMQVYENHPSCCPVMDHGHLQQSIMHQAEPHPGELVSVSRALKKTDYYTLDCQNLLLLLHTLYLTTSLKQQAENNWPPEGCKPRLCTVYRTFTLTRKPDPRGISTEDNLVMKLKSCIISTPSYCPFPPSFKKNQCGFLKARIVNFTTPNYLA